MDREREASDWGQKVLIIRRLRSRCDHQWMTVGNKRTDIVSSDGVEAAEGRKEHRKLDERANENCCRPFRHEYTDKRQGVTDQY